MAPDPIQQFREALSRRGIAVLGEIIADGRLHRCDADALAVELSTCA